MKVCKSCGEEKPLTDFHKYTGNKCRSPDGHRAVCKACRNAAMVEYRKKVKHA